MIVITAPTGNIGSQVLQQLVLGTEPVRVIARHPDQIPAALRDKVEVFAGSHGDADIVSQALEGADSVFWLPPGDMSSATANAAYVDFSRPGVEAMHRYGIERVVGVSALGRGWSQPAGHVTATLALDDLIAQSGVHYRALSCGSLMENMLRQLGSIIEKGVFYWPSPANLPLPFVATRDVASVATDLLLDPSWSGVDDIPLMGPDDISFGEMAAIMSEVLDRPIRFQEITMDDMHKLTLSLGASKGMAQSMIDMLTAKNEGIDHQVKRPEPNPTPTDFRQWCAEVLLAAAEAN